MFVCSCAEKAAARGFTWKGGDCNPQLLSDYSDLAVLFVEKAPCVASVILSHLIP